MQATIAPISINEINVTILAVPRVFKYNITLIQYNNSIPMTLYSVGLTLLDEENGEIQYILRDLEADVLYGVSITIEVVTSSGNRLYSTPYSQDLMTGAVYNIFYRMQ